MERQLSGTNKIKFHTLQKPYYDIHQERSNPS